MLDRPIDQLRDLAPLQGGRRHGLYRMEEPRRLCVIADLR
jgi:hypothetical protein